MDIGDEQEGGVDGLDALPGLAERRARDSAGHGKPRCLGQEAAPGDQFLRKAIHHGAKFSTAGNGSSSFARGSQELLAIDSVLRVCHFYAR